MRMLMVFVGSALFALYWAFKEYGLLKEKDVTEREWGYFLRAKYALNLWSAVLMDTALALMGVGMLISALLVGSWISLTIFGPKLLFKLLNRKTP